MIVRETNPKQIKEQLGADLVVRLGATWRPPAQLGASRSARPGPQGCAAGIGGAGLGGRALWGRPRPTQQTGKLEAKVVARSLVGVLSCQPLISRQPSGWALRRIHFYPHPDDMPVRRLNFVRATIRHRPRVQAHDPQLLFRLDHDIRAL